MLEPAPPLHRAPGHRFAGAVAARHSIERMSSLVAFSRWYSRLVGFGKVALPLLAVALAGLVAAWPTLRESQVGTRIREAGELVMANAHYVGTDKAERPFTVDAAWARQSNTEDGVIDLVKPTAEMTMQDGAWVTVNAERGRYNQRTGHLLLLGSVNLFQDRGYEFRTDEAHVNVSDNSAWGDRPVAGQGPFGTIQARGFRLLDGGQTVIFTGPASTELATGSSASAGGPTSAAPVPAAPQSPSGPHGFQRPAARDGAKP
jgi:lipopolysaccharide export system protein LptC